MQNTLLTIALVVPFIIVILLSISDYLSVNSTLHKLIQYLTRLCLLIVSIAFMLICLT